MARSGRFGSLPGKSPDLTSTITALLEQYENARDRNIYSAWLNGGKFEGSKVTDGRLLKFYKMRRSQYDKDDPEYDHWNQQVAQGDYHIGESKMLLRFEQGGIKEGGAAAWYTSNAKRFPKNSEAWREAMRNAARYKKAAQEARKAKTTISDSEKYRIANDRIYAQRIAPAIAAMDAWENALDRKHLSDDTDGFLTMGAGSMMSGEDGVAQDIKMRRFFRTKKGRSYARAYKNATGKKFSYKNFRQVLNRARQGYKQQAQNAKRFGFLSYVPGLNANAAGIGQWTTQLNIFTDDIYDDYNDLLTQFKDDINDAENSMERNAVRKQYEGQFARIAQRSAKRGDHVLAGSIDNMQDAIDGKGNITARNELSEGGKQGTSQAVTQHEVTYVQVKVTHEDGSETWEDSSEVDYSDLGTIETISRFAHADILQAEGHKDGTWGFVPAADGTLVEVNIEAHRRTNGMQAGTSSRDGGFVENQITMTDGTVSTVFHKLQPVSMRIGGKDFPLSDGIVSYVNSYGETRYQMLGPEGRMQDTSALPLDWVNNFDDGDGRTQAGEWWDESAGKNGALVQIATTIDNGQTIEIHPAFIRHYSKQVTDAWEGDEDNWSGVGEDKVLAEMTEDFFMEQLTASIEYAGRRFDEDGEYVVPGGAEVRTVQKRNPDFHEEKAPRGVVGNVPKAIDYLAGGRAAYNELDSDEQARIRTAAIEISEGGLPGADAQQLINEREALGYSFDAGTFTAEAEAIPAVDAADVTAPEIGDQPFNDEELKAELYRDYNVVNDEELEHVLGGRSTIEEALDKKRGQKASSTDAGINSETGERFMEDPAEVTARNEAEDAATVGALPTATIDYIVRQPAILTDAGSTMDTSGEMAQYQGPIGRAALAAMTPEARNEVALSIATKAGQARNPDYILGIAEDLDTLAAAGDAGVDEAEWFRLVGSMSDDERYQGALLNRGLRQMNPEVNTTGASLLQETFLTDLKNAGWSDTQLDATYPELVKEDKAAKQLESFQASGVDPFSGQPLAAPAVSSAGIALKGATENAITASNYGVNLNMPMPGTPGAMSASANRLILPKTQTVKPLTHQAPKTTAAPTLGEGLKKYGINIGAPPPVTGGLGPRVGNDPALRGAPPPTGSTLNNEVEGGKAYDY